MRLFVRTLAVLLALGLLCAVGAPGLAAEAEKGLKVYFFDLGRVDGILICCDGVNAFIDVGFKEDAQPALNYMKGLGVDHLDIYIGTHGHADHVAGAAPIIAEMGVKRIYVPHRGVRSVIIGNADSERQAGAVRAAKCTVLDDGDTFNIGGAKVGCLGPLSVVNCSTSALAENDNSLVLKLQYGERTFLFTGDTSDHVLRGINKKYPGLLKSDVLKNPHHNGRHDDDVIRMISPKVTVFTTDNENQPVRAYLRALKRQGSLTYITGSKNDGHIMLETDGKGMQLYRGYPLNRVKLNPVKHALYPGQKVQLKGTLTPSGATDPALLNWRSSNGKVAKVSGGVLTAVGEGAATITATAINGVSDSIEVEVLSAGVALNKSSLALKVGEEEKLKAKVFPADVEGITGEWLSSDESVAIVTQRGEVIGAGVGTARIIARLSNGAEAVCRVKVTDVPVESVRIDQGDLTLSLGQEALLTATLSPSNASNRNLEWRSSDESVLTVDMFGRAVAVGQGTAQVGARAASGAYDVCTITVR